MAHSQFIFTLFCTVGYCLGWRIITNKGQILYFLRQPLESLIDEIEIINNKIDALKQFDSNHSDLKVLRSTNKTFRRIVNLSTPVMLCITCFSSFWGLIIFYLLNGLSVSKIDLIILNSVIAAFIQTFIWNLYEKYL